MYVHLHREPLPPAGHLGLARSHPVAALHAPGTSGKACACSCTCTLSPDHPQGMGL